MSDRLKNPTIQITEEEMSDFALQLERAGYAGALELIKDQLVPLAKKENVSLIDAACKYADQDEERDTSYFQLFEALQKIKE